MNALIDIIFIPVGKPAEERSTLDDLKSLQELVGGDLEHLAWARPGLHLYFNEDGRRLRMELNIPVIGRMPAILGDAFLGRTSQSGRMVSIDQYDTNLYYMHIERARRQAGLVK